ncbi:uncharacterized protein STEHIDRAFT_142515, partial [Stereum hirsutum FP-91666 SS1]|uniref:uncharacterized protein n=1 Tax=Stereum hirsutum (strain FP-91666) TaxID=721885 RepID=UPI0004449F3C
MSWALATPDEMSTSVTGTLVLQPSGEWALEVVFALRETPQHHPNHVSLAPQYSSLGHDRIAQLHAHSRQAPSRSMSSPTLDSHHDQVRQPTPAAVAHAIQKTVQPSLDSKSKLKRETTAELFTRKPLIRAATLHTQSTSQPFDAAPPAQRPNTAATASGTSASSEANIQALLMHILANPSSLPPSLGSLLSSLPRNLVGDAGNDGVSTTNFALDASSLAILAVLADAASKLPAQ